MAAKMFVQGMIAAALTGLAAAIYAWVAEPSSLSLPRALPRAGLSLAGDFAQEQEHHHDDKHREHH